MRASDGEAVSQERSYQIGDPGSIARHHVLRARCVASAVTGHYSQFS